MGTLRFLVLCWLASLYVVGVDTAGGVLSLSGDGRAGHHRGAPAARARAVRRPLGREETGGRGGGGGGGDPQRPHGAPRVEVGGARRGGGSGASRTEARGGPQRVGAGLDGRGRAATPGGVLFLPPSSGEPISLELPMPVGEHARVEPTGHVMPLVAAYDEGRP